MKVLLISPLCQPSLWQNEIVSCEPPLGICYIASVLEKHGHAVRILERRRIIGSRRRTEKNLEGLDKETFAQLKAFNPDYIGVTATTPLIMDAYRVAQIAREANPHTKIMVGGCHPTAEPARTLKECEEIDVVCIGEGEFTFLEYVNGSPPKDIDGIAYRDNGRVSLTKPRSFYPELDSIPFPARHLLDKGYYFSPQSMTIRGFYLAQTTLLAARGCPYRCTFCQSGQLAKAGVGRYARFHSPERVIEEIKHLIRDFNINGLLFAEDMFSIKKENVLKICELLIREELDKKLKWAVNLRTDAADKELLEVMKRAGCVQVVYGCESGSQRTLDRLHKKTTVEKNYEAIKLAKGAGLTVEANIMIGLPGETEENFLETVKFLERARPDRINRGKLYPLPGTPIFEEMFRTRKINNLRDWNDLWDKYVANDFTFADISPNRFAELQALMDRKVICPINYVYKIKNNWKTYPAMALRQMILMVLHLGVLYMPLRFQKVARQIAEWLQVQSRYVAE
ncbi:MAG: radical SAM protein [Candidatus Brocadiaceae bacterium]|nr:radical SAM protein [Candidatus Brocadiaceae bacterium]